MSAVRQDYILRQIDLLRQFVSRLAKRRTEPELDEALLLAFHLQEKLFPVPPAEFLRLDLDEQIATLRRGESREAGNARCRTYATLLKETAELYDYKGQPDLAAGARQLALYAALQVSVDDPADAAAEQLVRDLLPAIDPTTLHAPVAALLEQLRSRNA